MLMISLDDAVKVAKRLIADNTDDEIIRQEMVQKCRNNAWIQQEASAVAESMNKVISGINSTEICNQITSDNLRKWCERTQCKLRIAMNYLPYQGKALPSAQPDSCNFPQLGATCEDGDELDEVMQHWIKQADEQGKVAEMYPEYADECKKISNDFRQLASWLKELKRLRTEVYFLKAERENTPVDLLGDVPCKTCRWKAETTEKCEECIDGITDNYEVQIECEDCVSRQAAIDALMEIMDRPNHADFLYTDEICKTLNDLPSAQPEPLVKESRTLVKDLVKDTISRQAAINKFCELLETTEENPVTCIRQVLDTLPSAQPEQTEMIKEIRKWINSANRGNADYFIVDKIEEIINRYE